MTTEVYTRGKAILRYQQKAQWTIAASLESGNNNGANSSYWCKCCLLPAAPNTSPYKHHLCIRQVESQPVYIYPDWAVVKLEFEFK